MMRGHRMNKVFSSPRSVSCQFLPNTPIPPTGAQATLPVVCRILLTSDPRGSDLSYSDPH